MTKRTLSGDYGVHPIAPLLSLHQDSQKKNQYQRLSRTDILSNKKAVLALQTGQNPGFGKLIFTANYSFKTFN